MDNGKVILDAKPIKVEPIKFEPLGSKRAFLVEPTLTDPSIQLSEWLSENDQRDPGLLGAFIYTMRSRNRNAAPRADFDNAFAAFAAEMPE